MHRLHLLAYQRPSKKSGQGTGRLLEKFDIGNGAALTEKSVSMLCEHIRRHMEEGDPPLSPGDALAPHQRPTTLWESMGALDTCELVLRAAQKAEKSAV